MGGGPRKRGGAFALAVGGGAAGSLVPVAPPVSTAAARSITNFDARPEKRSPADIELAREDFRTMAAILDKHLEGREFIVGDTLTVADCVTAYLIDWAGECNLIESFPQLRAYLERLYARPKAPQRIADARKAA